MPITRTRFDLAAEDEAVQRMFNRIVEVLKANSGSAYTEEEICARLDSIEPTTPEAQTLHDALSYLTAVGVVEQRVVRGSEYYAFATDL